MFCIEGTGAISHVSIRNSPDVRNEPELFAAIGIKGRPDLARVLEEAWPDEETSRAQAAANRVGVQHYSWDNAAQMYLRLFERLRTRESVLAGERG